MQELVPVCCSCALQFVTIGTIDTSELVLICMCTAGLSES